VIPFVHKNYEGKVPAAGALTELDLKQLAICKEQTQKVAAAIEACRFKAGLEEVMRLAQSGNEYLAQTQFWKQYKVDRAACATTLNVCLQIGRTLTTIMQPFLPFTARKCLAMLGLEESALEWRRACDELPAGGPLGEPIVLFRKLQDQQAK
jgi:methionyl-tRNA synthetase